MNSILDITETLMKDESVSEYEFHEYEPITGTNLNNSGEIRIAIETQDLFVQPSESYLMFEGQLVKEADGSAYDAADNIALTNNGLMYLFASIKYQLSGQEIECINDPGQATTMLGLLKYPDRAERLNQCWVIDTAGNAAGDFNDNVGWKTRRDYIIKDPDPKGTFSFCVPLKHIFGFAEDYDKVVYGFKHNLTLVRKAGKDAILKKADADEGKVNLTKISWFVPHVLPSDEEKFKLYKIIEEKSKLDVGYRVRQCETISLTQTTNCSWRLGVKSSPERPRWIIIGFQTLRDGNEEMNSAIFDHCKLKNICVMLNSTRYPAVDYNASFTKNQFSRLYNDAECFRSKFYHMDELLNKSNLSPQSYKELFPIYVIDVSKQSEKLKNSVTDIHIKMQFDTNVPESTQAYAVVISDRILTFESNGNKMNLIM